MRALLTITLFIAVNACTALENVDFLINGHRISVPLNRRIQLSNIKRNNLGVPNLMELLTSIAEAVDQSSLEKYASDTQVPSIELPSSPSIINPKEYLSTSFPGSNEKEDIKPSVGKFTLSQSHQFLKPTSNIPVFELPNYISTAAIPNHIENEQTNYTANSTAPKYSVVEDQTSLYKSKEISPDNLYGSPLNEQETLINTSNGSVFNVFRSSEAPKAVQYSHIMMPDAQIITKNPNGNETPIVSFTQESTSKDLMSSTSTTSNLTLSSKSKLSTPISSLKPQMPYRASGPLLASFPTVLPRTSIVPIELSTMKPLQSITSPPLSEETSYFPTTMSSTQVTKPPAALVALTKIPTTNTHNSQGMRISPWIQRIPFFPESKLHKLPETPFPVVRKWPGNTENAKHLTLNVTSFNKTQPVKSLKDTAKNSSSQLGANSPTSVTIFTVQSPVTQIRELLKPTEERTLPTTAPSVLIFSTRSITTSKSKTMVVSPWIYSLPLFPESRLNKFAKKHSPSKDNHMKRNDQNILRSKSSSLTKSPHLPVISATTVLSTESTTSVPSVLEISSQPVSSSQTPLSQILSWQPTEPLLSEMELYKSTENPVRSMSLSTITSTNVVSPSNIVTSVVESQSVVPPQISTKLPLLTTQNALASVTDLTTLEVTESLTDYGYTEKPIVASAPIENPIHHSTTTLKPNSSKVSSWLARLPLYPESKLHKFTVTPSTSPSSVMFESLEIQNTNRPMPATSYSSTENIRSLFISELPLEKIASPLVNSAPMPDITTKAVIYTDLVQEIVTVPGIFDKMLDTSSPVHRPGFTTDSRMTIKALHQKLVTILTSNSIQDTTVVPIKLDRLSNNSANPTTDLESSTTLVPVGSDNPLDITTILETPYELVSENTTTSEMSNSEPDTTQESVLPIAVSHITAVSTVKADPVRILSVSSPNSILISSSETQIPVKPSQMKYLQSITSSPLTEETSHLPVTTFRTHVTKTQSPSAALTHNLNEILIPPWIQRIPLYPESKLKKGIKTPNHLTLDKPTHRPTMSETSSDLVSNNTTPSEMLNAVTATTQQSVPPVAISDITAMPTTKTDFISVVANTVVVDKLVVSSSSGIEHEANVMHVPLNLAFASSNQLLDSKASTLKLDLNTNSITPPLESDPPVSNLVSETKVMLETSDCGHSTDAVSKATEMPMLADFVPDTVMTSVDTSGVSEATVELVTSNLVRIFTGLPVFTNLVEHTTTLLTPDLISDTSSKLTKSNITRNTESLTTTPVTLQSFSLTNKNSTNDTWPALGNATSTQSPAGKVKVPCKRRKSSKKKRRSGRKRQLSRTKCQRLKRQKQVNPSEVRQVW